MNPNFAVNENVFRTITFGKVNRTRKPVPRYLLRVRIIRGRFVFLFIFKQFVYRQTNFPGCGSRFCELTTFIYLPLNLSGCLIASALVPDLIRLHDAFLMALQTSSQTFLIQTHPFFILHTQTHTHLVYTLRTHAYDTDTQLQHEPAWFTSIRGFLASEDTSSAALLTVQRQGVNFQAKINSREFKFKIKL